MKLYYIPAACSLAPHIVLHELGQDFTLIKVDYKKHKTEDGQNFLNLNPLGYAPLLELNEGVFLREGPVIMQYLADLKPSMDLAPAYGGIERYRLQEWLNFLTSEIHKGFIPLLYPVQAGKYGTEFAKPKLEQRYKWIDAQLAGKEYLMGRYSVADSYLYALTQWGQAKWLFPTYKANIGFDGLENLKAWYLRMRERPAVRKALNAEGLQ
ncbi:glutathione transferase GstA [Comamonas testosteroni]|uniref:glutathione transferase GstA n=1 Tax=Comamonas testosteroni TaxID=285 RepID=UPI0023AABA98|nr:glutathione transferase GstA [Comamonas testosteroni]WEE76663.1 glutathione transferase GstA [Comamonas testosteroni]